MLIRALLVMGEQVSHTVLFGMRRFRSAWRSDTATEGFGRRISAWLVCEHRLLGAASPERSGFTWWMEVSNGELAIAVRFAYDDNPKQSTSALPAVLLQFTANRLESVLATVAVNLINIAAQLRWASQLRRA